MRSFGEFRQLYCFSIKSASELSLFWWFFMIQNYYVKSHSKITGFWKHHFFEYRKGTNLCHHCVFFIPFVFNILIWFLFSDHKWHALSVLIWYPMQNSSLKNLKIYFEKIYQNYQCQIHPKILVFFSKNIFDFFRDEFCIGYEIKTLRTFHLWSLKKS